MTHKARTRLLPRLKKFYRNEERGYPHRDIDLFNLAYDVSECLEDYSTCCGCGGEDMLEHAKRTRKNPTATNIDTGVNFLHRDILNYGLASDEDIDQFLFYESLAEYLLSRE